MHNIENVLDDMPFEFRECRAYGHMWKHHRVDTNRRQSMFWITQICARCENFRSQEMDSYGDASKWQMHYENGYRVQGLGRITKDQRKLLRLSAIQGIMTRVISDD